MKILTVGGGSGGHVTPLVAVLKELQARHPRAELRVWCDKPFHAQARSLVGAYDASIPISTIVAGKLRRYHHLTLWQHLTWPSLMLHNTRDVFLVGVGTLQSIMKLLVWRPDVVFTKGGYVCLPVGLAARLLRIPLVIHDSDAHPGLTNRILSRWATFIATGAPLEYYNYPRSKSTYVGIPISEDFAPASATSRREAKQQQGVDPERPLLVVTGGGLGAKRINDTVAVVLKKLQQHTSVILIAGAGQYDELRSLLPADSSTFQLHPFVTTMPQLVTAADIVVTRAGATTMLELAAARVPTIIIPNAKLTGGHQLKNAKVYEDAKSAIVLDEETMEAKPQLLVDAVKGILEDKKGTEAMATRFGAFAKPDAAKDVAALIDRAARR